VCIPRSQKLSRLSPRVTSPPHSLQVKIIEVWGVDIRLDPGFSEFYDWTLEHNVPVVVLSSGMEPMIRALLAKLVGPKAQGIPIISNKVDISPDGSWKLVFHDESGIYLSPPLIPTTISCLLSVPLFFPFFWTGLIGSDFGHDKSRAIRPYAALPADNRPILVYCGDGVSDISAARETDLLFAKKGRDLVKHCILEDVPFYPFDVQNPNSLRFDHPLFAVLCSLFPMVSVPDYYPSGG
jgi:2,3-diketo-5-methylthio-1-phosphopentane phosphatase